MRVNGEWLLCADGERRPGLTGLLQVADGAQAEVTLLLDGGADRTVFSADLLALLRPLEVVEPEQKLLAGIGGSINFMAVETTLGFTRDDGQPVKVRGQFGVFTSSENADLSVLGRDVTDNFNVIYDAPHQLVALLAPPHYYEIKRGS